MRRLHETRETRGARKGGMRNTTAIMRRELLSLFCSPVAYIVIFGFLLITGILVWVTQSFEPGKPATLRNVFQWTPFVLTVILPAIAMRSISEEYRSGTIESVATAPVSDFEFVLGKYLAVFFFYLIMLLGTTAYLLLMMYFGNPDVGASISAYIGLIMLGMFFSAFGVFASSLTNNQIVAWMVGAVPLLLLTTLAYWVVSSTSGVAREIAQQVNFMGRFENFARGSVSLEGLAFFFAASLFFVFLAVKVVESRRWR